MENKIIKIISDRTELSVDYLRENRNKQRLWDSLQRVEIVLALEEEFDLLFEPEEIESMLDIQAIVSLIQGKVE